jgi:hypothetical protein
MAGKLGKFQKQTFNYWKGDTLKKHHMGAIFLRFWYQDDSYLQ